MYIYLKKNIPEQLTNRLEIIENKNEKQIYNIINMIYMII